MKAQATSLQRHLNAAPAHPSLHPPQPQSHYLAQAQAQAQAQGVLTFQHTDHSLSQHHHQQQQQRQQQLQLGASLTDADASYFHQLEMDDIRERSAAALQVVPPSALATHETALTAMLHHSLSSAGGEAGAGGGVEVGRDLLGKHSYSSRAGAESSFVRGLLAPSLGDSSRAADHRHHISQHMQQKRHRALAHLPTLMPSVNFVKSMEDYNRKLRLAQEMKNIPFDARGISSCFVGDRCVHCLVLFCLVLSCRSGLSGFSLICGHDHSRCIQTLSLTSFHRTPFTHPCSIADIVMSTVIDDVAEELEGFFDEYSLAFSSQI